MSYDLYVKVLFENFSEDELRKLLSISKQCKFQSGDYLFREGDESYSMYIIFTGNVEISSSGFKDKITFQDFSKNGTVLGEVAFFDGKPRTASVRAIDNIVAMQITKDEFSKIEKEDPGLAIKFLKEIGKITAERLRSADLQVKELSALLNK
jgi:CRP-like cAMP-binding protein